MTFSLKPISLRLPARSSGRHWVQKTGSGCIGMQSYRTWAQTILWCKIRSVNLELWTEEIYLNLWGLFPLHPQIFIPFSAAFTTKFIKKKKVSIVSFQSSCNSTSFRLLLYSNKMTFVKVSHDLHTVNLMVSSQSSSNLTSALNVVNLSFLLKNGIFLATRTPQTPVMFFPLAT